MKDNDNSLGFYSQLSEINQMRMLAIVGVLVNHLHATKVLVNVGHIFTFSGVFALFSGFLLTRNVNTANELLLRCRKRFQRIIIVYIAWTVIYFFCYQIIMEMIDWFEISYFDFIQKPNNMWDFKTYFTDYFLRPRPASFWYLQHLILAIPFILLIWRTLFYRFSLLFFIVILCSLHYLDLIEYHQGFYLFLISGLYLGVNYPNGPMVINGSITLPMLGMSIILAVSILYDSTYLMTLEMTKFLLNLSFVYLLFNILRKIQSLAPIIYLNKKAHLAFLILASHGLLYVLLGGLLVFLFNFFGWEIILNGSSRFLYGLLVIIATFFIVDKGYTWLSAHFPRLLGILDGRLKKI